MNKLTGALIVVAILAAAIIGAGLATRSMLEAPAIVAARADHEQAKAAAAWAQARLADEDVARAKLTTQVQVSTQDQAASTRMLLLASAGISGAIAIAIGLIGGALAMTTWVNLRARIVYPDSHGQWPVLIERRWGGDLVIADTSRSSSPMILLTGGQMQSLVDQGPGEALQVTTQAQAAAMIAAVASKAQGAQAIEQAGRVAAQAHIPAPTFAAGDSMRFVYVNGRGTSQESRDLADLQEFIQLGADVRGLARRAWVGQQFGSGRQCTRSRYDDMVRRLERARVIEHDGQSWKFVVPSAEALERFGLTGQTGLGGPGGRAERDLAEPVVLEGQGGSA